ncbi:hypothetical protein OUZ56_029470 [Daphnia magna]|uniref:Peptidase A2 domain-containing protein n=1 Tax=Daphnia magna TaxID=35525 RepID=A0ABR0B6X5_9CRUS|nr:hypothetical protein OUZ56_029470 [Daphnia magna]
MELLTDRFAAQDRLKKHYLAELKAMTNTRLSETSALSQWQKLHDGLANSVAALTSLGVDTRAHQAYLAPDLLASFPRALVSRWRDRWEDKEPTFSKILKALKTEIRLREEDETSASSCSGKSVPKSAATTTNNGNRGMACLLCQKIHLHHNCNQGSSAQRRAAAEKEGRCLNTEHSPAVCVASPRGGGYAPAPAGNRGYSPQRAPKVVTIDTTTLTISTRSKTGVLPTFTAYLKGSAGDRVKIVGLIDSGSERTFVREDTPTRVGAEKIRAEYLAVNGFGDQNKAGKNHAVFGLRLAGLSQDAPEIKIEAIAWKFLANAKKVTPTDF